MEANRWRQLIRWYELGESRQIIQAILEQPPLQRDYDTVSLLARALCAERRYEEAAEQLGDELMKSYPDCDVEINYGGQPIYYCVVSVE